jgi:phospholipase/carboxylesterase
MQSFMKSTKFGQLGAMIMEAYPDASEQTVVLLHGYGAPGTDLITLGSEIVTPKKTRYVFLQAPHVLPGMTGPFAGRAWWEINMLELQIISMTQDYDLLAQSHPSGLDEATTLLNEALEQLVSTTSCTWDQLYVGGFSQGAMLTCNWALHTPHDLAGLIQLSGSVICQQEWTELLKNKRGLRVFQSHSPEDQVLPFTLAERLKKLLVESGQNHTWLRFSGGHGISAQVLGALGQFLG